MKAARRFVRQNKKANKLLQKVLVQAVKVLDFSSAGNAACSIFPTVLRRRLRKPRLLKHVPAPLTFDQEYLASSCNTVSIDQVHRFSKPEHSITSDVTVFRQLTLGTSQAGVISFPEVPGDRPTKFLRPGRRESNL